MLAFRILLAVSAGIWATFGHAQSAGELAECREIDNEVARLNCYDAAVVKILDGSEQAEKTIETSGVAELDMGNWTVQSGTDPLTDEETFLAALESSEGVSSFQKPTLLIRCKQNSSEVFVAWGEYLSDNALVTSRFGAEKPSTFTWEEASDQTATFLGSERHAWFFKSALSSEKFVAQIEPYRSGPITAVFNLAGIQVVMADKSTVCGLPLK